tara:strand:- start:1061 stop:1339 length:279 start_codon:yes stop_codon:yes gene_type:complete
MIKVVIVFMLLAMVVSLGVGLYHLVKTPDERDKGDKVVKALTWRIAISAALFGFIVLAVQMGWIKPSISINPERFNDQQQQRIDIDSKNENP